MKKTAPDRWGIIARRATSRVKVQVASTARRCTARQPFGLMSSAGAVNCPPALLTSTSILPKASSVRSTTSVICCSSRMSAGTARQVAPVASTALRVSSSGSGRRPQSTMSAPPAARSSAVARPMPVPPPVISATLPACTSGRSTVAAGRGEVLPTGLLLGSVPWVGLNV